MQGFGRWLGRAPGAEAVRRTISTRSGWDAKYSRVYETPAAVTRVVATASSRSSSRLKETGGTSPGVPSMNRSPSGALLSGGGGITYDPHVWLDPLQMAGFAAQVGDALREVDPTNSSAYSASEASAIADLTGLLDEFKTGLASCKYRTFVVSHEAFGYLAAATGLKQIGIQGLVPEPDLRDRKEGEALFLG